MSRRTFPRIAAGLLAVAAIASPPPAIAQSPNPWRCLTVETAPAPRPKGRTAEVEVYWNWTFSEPAIQPAPAARYTEAKPIVSQHTQPQPVFIMTYSDRPVAAPSPPAASHAVACPHPVPPPPANIVNRDAYVVAPPLQATVRPMPPMCVQPAPLVECRMTELVNVMAPATRLAGTWYREMPGCVIAVTFKGDECHATITLNDAGATAKVTMTADCSVTKDGTVYGVITGVDVDLTAESDLPGLAQAGLALELQSVVDQPFAFRCRSCDGGLMVSNVRLPGRDCPPEMCAALAGKFKSAAYTSVPMPKPTKANVGVCVPGRCDTALYPTDAVIAVHGGPYPAPPIAFPPPVFGPPVPWQTEQIEIKYAQPAMLRGPILPPMQCLPPMPVTCPNPGACPMPCPASCPPDTFELMRATFGQMLNGPQPIVGMTLPSPRYLQLAPQYFPPDSVFPLPRELASQVPACPVACPTPTVPRPAVGIAMTGAQSPTAAPCLPPPMSLPAPLPGCQTTGSSNCPAIGIGSMTGAALGTPRTGAVVGGLIGAGLGGAVGNEVDRQCQQAKLSQADVVDLTKAGCGDDVIINQIRKTGSTYDLSVKDIVNLKKSGVGDAVIIEMQGNPPPPPSLPPQLLTPERIHGGIM